MAARSRFVIRIGLPLWYFHQNQGAILNGVVGT
jgi:hypothetical protein